VEEVKNCHLAAWERFVRQGGYIVLRRSNFCAADDASTPWWWLPFYAIGIILQHVGSWITFAGWMLRWRCWYHASWASELNGDWWEYVPKGEKRKRHMPPVFFDGEWQKVDPIHEKRGY